jgi:hypothetical protein
MGDDVHHRQDQVGAERCSSPRGTDDLVKLKEAGVSKSVMAAMLDRRAPQSRRLPRLPAPGAR